VREGDGETEGVDRCRFVFRGVSNGKLPLPWLLEDLMGSKGGAEFAFMSTSMDLHEAAKYAARGFNPMVFMIELGSIDKGANIQELSQYPGEVRHCFLRRPYRTP